MKLFSSQTEHHELVIAALERGVELVSEIELGYRWEQERSGGPRPMLAVTGTVVNGLGLGLAVSWPW